jgi:hypothetical protein
MNDSSVAELEEATQELVKPAKAIKQAHAERLTFKEYRDQCDQPYHRVETGILWIPPFVTDFWTGRRVKPKPNKCICTCCGNKHSLKGGR